MGSLLETKPLQGATSLDKEDFFWNAFVSFAGTLGFAYVFYSDVPTHADELAGRMIRHVPHPAWFEHYARNNYASRDPVLKHAKRALSPFTLDEVLSSPDYTPEEKSIPREASEFGIYGGFFIPLRSPQNRPALIGLFGGRQSPNAEERASLQVAAHMVDLGIRPPYREADTNLIPSLSARESQCLGLMALGKGDAEIGAILGISEKTSNFHIENIKRKFKASTRIYAVAKAMRAGFCKDE